LGTFRHRKAAEGNPRRGGIRVVRWPRPLTGKPAWALVTTKANHPPVGVHASAIKAIAMFTLSIQLQLSYKQLVQIIALLLMLFFG